MESINRIASLMKYDWMLHKHSIKLTYLVIAIIYVCIAILFTLFKLAFDDEPMSGTLPPKIATACILFFNWAKIAVVLTLATLVTEKFCYKRTATAYLTLPGTSLEKFCVVLLDFIVALLAFQVLAGIMFGITLGIGHLLSPELNWGQQWKLWFFSLNVPSHDYITENITVKDQLTGIEGGPEFLSRIFDLIRTSTYMQPFSALVSLGYYLVLVMLFKTNVQLKAIGCEILTYVVFMITLITGFIAFVANNLSDNPGDVEVQKTMFKCTSVLFDGVTIWLYMLPVVAIGLLYVFYRQIVSKQAK